MPRTWTWFVLAVSLSCTIQNCAAIEDVPPGFVDLPGPPHSLDATPTMQKYYDLLNRRIYGNQASTGFIPSTSVILTMRVLPDGRIRDLVLGPSSGDDSTDFACMEAALSVSPFAGPEQEIARLNDGKAANAKFVEVHFFKTRYPSYFKIPAEQRSTEEKFFEKNPTYRGKAVAIHVIPLDVTSRYPGLFSLVELSSTENIRAIKTKGLFTSAGGHGRRSLSNPEVLAFFKAWEDFFEKHASPDKETVIAQKDHLMKQFGGLFMQ